MIEIETTSSTGFDWVHDERFYREAAAQWSASRGLRPVTLEEYQHRKLLEPYQLMAQAMTDPEVAPRESDRYRLAELAALVAGDDLELQKWRVQAYDHEAHELYEAKAWRTMAKLFDAVGPAVADIGSRSRDARTLELVSWAKWQQAHALMIVGRRPEAAPLLADGIEHVDPGWESAANLKNNYLSLFNDVMCDLIDRKDYTAAVKVFEEHRAVCLADQICAGNVAVVYGNWSIDYSNAGDWPSARRVLQECVAALPGDGRCRDALADLESRHRF
jgi:hypothetical protein